MSDPNDASAKPAPVVCEHLAPLLAYAVEQGAEIGYVGQAWSRNCRTWVYTDMLFPLDELRAKFHLPAVVEDHVHRGTHDGAEQGFACAEHHDAVMGPHPDLARSGSKTLR